LGKLGAGQRWAVLVFLCGVTASTLVWQALRTQDRRLREAEFEVLTQECIHAVEKSFLMHLEAVHVTADYFAATPLMSRHGFHEFTTPLLERHLPIQALEWIPKISREDRERHEASAVEEGLAGYRIKEATDSGSLTNASEREEYFPVFYVEPLEGNRPALGFDLGSEPVRREALMAARELRRLTLTARIVLVQETADLFGVLAFQPVYTSEEDGGDLLGFMLGVLRVGEIVDDALHHIEPRSVSVVVRDESAPKEERFLYARSGSKKDDASLVDVASRVSGERTLQLGNRTWSVHCQPTAAYLSERRSWDQLATLASGFVVSGLLATLIVILSGQKSRVQREVDHRTAELREANRKLEEEIASGDRTREKLRAMTSEVFLAEERERRKLAVDLHDDLGQLLPLLRMRLAVLRNDPKAASIEDQLAEVVGLVDQASQSLRSLTFQTMPPILQDLGLGPAIEWLIKDVRLRFGVQSEIECESATGDLNDDVRIIVYRSVRELIINAAKHAEAERIKVSIQREASILRVVVEDDGKGFDPVALPDGMEFGLFSIRERLSYLGGDLVIDSSPGRGTRAIIELPVDTPIEAPV
jgi:signal transduction histidine kinase